MLINEGIRLRQRYTALFFVVVVVVVTIIIVIRTHMRDCSIVTLCVLSFSTGRKQGPRLLAFIELEGRDWQIDIRIKFTGHVHQ